ncbi:N-acetylmuramoyl-L-alanine amidase-like domain-containing protein [Legionella sp. D16C41]|uniref:N-acetylmuramoyl-L-alanine amidase-like domain-containing protein n=1 Tax=Legionella sp. D16C41 TaxID=3402688 RepID=UPI003AF5F3C9
MPLIYKFLKIQRLIYFFIFLFISLPLAADDLIETQANLAISELYHSLNDNLNLEMATRIDKISAYFLDRPYILGSLGEGSTAPFDQFPRYRTDGFDCETYVTTVIALALANQLTDFTQCLSKIRYYQGQVDYLARNHFTGLDWNGNNQQQGFVKDITTTIKDKNNRPVAQTAIAVIDKPSWYQHMQPQTIRLKQNNTTEQAKRLEILKKMGNQLPRSEERVPYVPLSALFNAQGEPNYALFNQIPNAAIVEIVRPNWDLSTKIGTHLNISHLGLVFWKGGQLVFRQASSEYGKVTEVPLISYLKNTLQSPTIKGINIQVIAPSAPLNNGCRLSN